MTTTRQLRHQVNEAVIQALEQGVVPWRSDHGFPRNAFSRRRYGGIEAVSLMLACQRQGFTSGFWATRDEWEALGGKVEGGPGTQVVVRTGRLFESLRPLTVYNLCQVAGDFPVSRKERPAVDYALADRIVAGTRADIRFTDKRVAEYHFPGTDPDGDGDYIKLCRKEQFERGLGGVNGFYLALFHELAHWTEPGARVGFWGTTAVNELRAEMASDFLTTELAIPGCPYACRSNVHKYRDAWVKEMRCSPRTIFKVAASAAQAVDYVLGFTAGVEPRHRSVEE
jgi:antirestriction protein ArdC